MSEIRVRFAPSPTGYLHIGGVRTALYNYLFAKKNNGKFILRIEDTDQNRFVKGAEEYINEALKWCGLEPDESPEKGGPFAPYKQSQRKDIYKQYVADLLKTDYAYIAFDTPEELEKLRTDYEAQGKVFSYNFEIRNNLNNSLNLSNEIVQQKINSGVPYVIRFKIPPHRTLVLSDIIRGNFSIDTSTLDDKVLVKTDGMPTYHLANIVDDHTMEITHVIRGEEWLPSLALHVLLYEAFGWNAPKFAHLPLILKPEGKGKLSKRDGDKSGFPVFPLAWINEKDGTSSIGYREEGYLPEAFINMLALLGWSPTNDKEILSMKELVQEFDLEKVHKSGARFNPEKAKWFNHEYIVQSNASMLLPHFQKILKEKGIEPYNTKDLRIIELLKERVNFIQEIWKIGSFFWIAPSSYEEKNYKKVIKGETATILSQLYTGLQSVLFSERELHDYIHDYVEKSGLGFGKVMQPLRLALVGELKGPDIPIIMEILGKKESLQRIKNLELKI
ncbi:glutamate--tRNA ligase [Apibacter adventoris]|uniref:Glutamate--tRNA ligase n=1 Tax=Apibacter adventoris TaxID=1679466 RepID=A0A2S8A7M6_9FLAO|nr:glutamate--tRNA ligase [Apibacter adventoris]PQL90496.1 glutamate--tRNA ligase [Apibacter adventoris]